MENLEKEILEIINEAIGGKYIGGLKILIEDDIYELLLYLNQEMAPLVLGFQGAKSDFKEFIRKEMKTRQMERADYWTTNLSYLPDNYC